MAQVRAARRPRLTLPEQPTSVTEYSGHFRLVRGMSTATEGFAGRTVLLTGGAGGIGQALARALLERGALVGVLDRRVAEVATMSVECDVTHPDEVAGAVAELESELGPTRFLVCAAGVVSERKLAELEPAEWRRVVGVSLDGAFAALRAVVPGMQARRSGSVVAFSSGYATMGYRFGGPYAAAKAGVEALVKSVALEAGGDGVRVNAVAPGPVVTSMLDHVPDKESWRRDRVARIPLGRLAEPEDLVGPVLFLLGPGSAYVTGQTLHVNGGLLMS